MRLLVDLYVFVFELKWKKWFVFKLHCTDTVSVLVNIVYNIYSYTQSENGEMVCMCAIEALPKQNTTHSNAWLCMCTCLYIVLYIIRTCDADSWHTPATATKIHAWCMYHFMNAIFFGENLLLHSHTNRVPYSAPFQFRKSAC